MAVGDMRLKTRPLAEKGAGRKVHCLLWEESFKAIVGAVMVHLHYLPGFVITGEIHLGAWL